jgi:hypothetical protein
VQDGKNYCKFKLNIGDGGEISSIWKYLWGLNKKDKRKENIEKVGVQLKPDSNEKSSNEKNLRVNMNF